MRVPRPPSRMPPSIVMYGPGELSHPVTVLVAVALTICSNERVTESGDAEVVVAVIGGPLVSRLHAATRTGATARIAMMRFMRSSRAKESRLTATVRPAQSSEEAATRVPHDASEAETNCADFCGACATL